MTDNPKPEKLNQLKQRFGLNRLPLEVGMGWYPLVEQFLEEARAAGELEKLELYQVKEKFGELRIYHNGSRYLERVTIRLGHVSMGVCELCGEPGRHRTDGRVEGTRCYRCEDIYDTDKRSFRVDDMPESDAEELRRGLRNSKYGE